MTVFWSVPASERLTVRDVVDSLESSHPVAYSTAITVIERLRAKHWLDRARAGKAYQYWPTGTENDYIAQLMQELLNSSDNPAAALLSFAGSLDPDEAKRLRQALNG